MSKPLQFFILLCGVLMGGLISHLLGASTSSILLSSATGAITYGLILLMSRRKPVTVAQATAANIPDSPATAVDGSRGNNRSFTTELARILVASIEAAATALLLLLALTGSGVSGVNLVLDGAIFLVVMFGGFKLGIHLFRSEQTATLFVWKVLSTPIDR